MMGKTILPAWATLEQQAAHKAISEDTNERVRALQMDATPIGAVHYHVAVSTGSGNNIYIKDPEDRIIGGVPAAYWSHTVVVRKQGSAPESIDDGTVVFSNSVRDAFFTTPFLDEDGNSESIYRCFAFAASGSVNASADGIFSVGAPWTMGYVLDTSDSDPAMCVTYTADNADFSPVRMNFSTGVCDYGHWKNWVEANFKPAMLMSSGEVAYYLNPDDLTEKVDGTSSDVANTSFDGNAMLIVSPIFFKISQAGALVTVLFSNVKQDASWTCWTHLKSDGTYAPFCGWPLFEGVNLSSKLRSLATNGKPTGNLNQTNEYAYAVANGANWYTTTWADEQMMRLLFPLLTKHLDSNETIGQCYVSGASALQLNCGSMKDKGAFWGARFNGTNNVTTGCKFLGMENIWSHRWRRPCGIAMVNGVYFMKMTPSKIDGSNVEGFVTSDTAVDYTGAYISEGGLTSTSYSAAYISKMLFGDRAGMLPVIAGGSSATYFCDGCWSSSGVRCLSCGGLCFHGLLAGAFASALAYAPSLAYWNLGASLSYHAF